MTEDIRGRTIGQFPLVDADTINPATARVPIWREEQSDGNRIAAITPDELRQLVADGLLDKAEADLLYAPIGVVAASGAVRIPFGFGDATPKTLGAFGHGLLARVSIVIETAFDGAPSALSIGTATQPALYLPVAANDPAAINEYEVTPDIFLLSPTGLVLAISPGLGITQGGGHVIIQVYP